MSEQKVLRMLAAFIRPNRISDIELHGEPDGQWAARVTIKGSADRWFKGTGRTWREEVWFAGEDQHRQHALP